MNINQTSEQILCKESGLLPETIQQSYKWALKAMEVFANQENKEAFVKNNNLMLVILEKESEISSLKDDIESNKETRSDAMEFVTWLEDNGYSCVYSNILKKRAWTNEEFLLHGNDIYYSSIVSSGKSIEELYDLFIQITIGTQTNKQ